jgi:hypothetical protein
MVGKVYTVDLVLAFRVSPSYYMTQQRFFLVLDYAIVSICNRSRNCPECNF